MHQDRLVQADIAMHITHMNLIDKAAPYKPLDTELKYVINFSHNQIKKLKA